VTPSSLNRLCQVIVKRRALSLARMVAVYVALSMLCLVAQHAMANPTVVCTYAIGASTTVETRAGTASGVPDARSWETFQATAGVYTTVASLDASSRYLVRTLGGVMVEPGTACPATVSGLATGWVLMNVSDYTSMTNGAAVNETLFYLGLVVCLAIGFLGGYYLTGPRRRSIIEVNT
jgi:hypothetical protein